ncbi:hypothetical protein C1701_06070 [Actinoalloteichus sp. AHMU CJ021]|uniref:hypothetical protein n=1 Tax=Actinoalloteichus sp. AHMU CJ021 TaxID=2072503 RepID=UPI000CA02019|nr:hypothetical protein C1701_06070 [Actinoalloteichus sp. AHMU CJ021]
MRLVRLGEPVSAVGNDLRAALVACGTGRALLGGVGVLGGRPAGSAGQVDAVLVLPRAVLVVVGVDLPEPVRALRAPLDAPWNLDGTPLPTQAGGPHPAAAARTLTAEIQSRLNRLPGTVPPVRTLIAVGPFVERVEQAPGDRDAGVRVFHPSPATVLGAARELADHPAPCQPADARRVLDLLFPPGSGLAAGMTDLAGLTEEDLAREGFGSDATTTGTTSTGRSEVGPTGTTREPPPSSGPHRPTTGRTRLTWQGWAAAVVGVGVLAAGGVVLALSGSDQDVNADQPESSAGENTAEYREVAADSGTGCADNAFGDVRTWLREHDCSTLSRGLLDLSVNGRAVGVSLAVATFADEDTAGAFQDLVESPGRGGVDDLLRDGHEWPTGPDDFHGAAFVTSREGAEVRIAQAVWSEGGADPQDATLQAAARNALRVNLR